ncbi:Rho-binding antiterminator [Vulgatibacter sp.]|uniref:Rho-binding antiterminator n=1 Tax=Vulgatibacter sp. TaxID=1971226 RepID=UPI00356A8364
MSRYDRNELGNCDFIDVLEESVLMHTRVRVELLDGTVFEDKIRDVVTRDGQEEVLFASHEPVEVRDMAAIVREPLPHTYQRDPRREAPSGNRHP